jgi:hypothetical protein
MYQLAKSSRPSCPRDQTTPSASACASPLQESARQRCGPSDPNLASAPGPRKPKPRWRASSGTTSFFGCIALRCPRQINQPANRSRGWVFACMLRHPHLPSGHDGRQRLERLAPVHEDVLQQRVAAGVADDGVEHGARRVHGVGGEGPLPLTDLGLALHLPVARQLLRGQHLLRAAGVVCVQPRHRVRRPVVERRQLREHRGQPARRRHERLLLRRGTHRPPWQTQACKGI